MAAAPTSTADGRPLQALSSHLLRPGESPGLEIFPLIVLRDPLDRAYSCYSYERRVPPSSETGEVAKQVDFAGYVRWCLDHPRRGGMVIIDYQTIHLSQASFRTRIHDAAATDADLDQAARVLRDLPVVGVVDRFESYCARLRPALDEWTGRALDLGETRRVNTSPERLQRPLSDTKTYLRAILGEETARRFERANRRDQDLYDLAARLAAAQARDALDAAAAHTLPEHRLRA